MKPGIPQRDSGKWPSLVLAALVHILLALFLFFGVRWQNPAPEAVEVSVVDGLPPPPPTATPEPPRPEPKPEPRPTPKPEAKPLPPPPAKPEIVTKAKPKQVEKQPKPPKPVEKPKLENKSEPKPKSKLASKSPPLDDNRLKDLLASETRQVRETEADRQLANQLAEENQRVAAARANLANAKALDSYKNKIRVKVRGNIILPLGISGNPEAVFLVSQAVDGTILEIRLKRSSGNPALDSAIEKAIQKSSPLPKPEKEELFERNLELNFRPLED
ncbi:MAG: energy transducer TonB [Rhodocyclaceae bacterium]|jgi:colicin import membrane protein|nr:energy transducer TonB [Rhodocyclaceae bacterium]